MKRDEHVRKVASGLVERSKPRRKQVILNPKP
jgi:hypothetical protein